MELTNGLRVQIREELFTLEHVDCSNSEDHDDQEPAGTEIRYSHAVLVE